MTTEFLGQKHALTNNISDLSAQISQTNINNVQVYSNTSYKSNILQKQALLDESSFSEKYNKMLKDTIDYSNRNFKFKFFIKELIASYCNKDQQSFKFNLEKIKELLIHLKRDDEEAQNIKNMTELKIKNLLSQATFPSKQDSINILTEKKNMFLDSL